MTTPKAWSYSALTKFENCPWQYKLTAITKQVIEPQSPQMTWGNEVHKALENRVKAQTPLPTNMAQYEPLVSGILAKGGVVTAEQKMALDINLNPVTYFSKNPPVWVRAVSDFESHKNGKLLIVDWKTGKPNPDSGQLKLAAAISMAHKPYVSQCVSAFAWLNEGKFTIASYTREDLGAIWADFIPRAKRLDDAVANDVFPKKPSGLCKRWCPVGKSLCEHCGS